MNSAKIYLSLCTTPLWDAELLWDTRSPKLSSCFKLSVLSVAPSIILFLICICQVIWRWSCSSSISTHSKKHPSTTLFIAKQCINLLLVILTSVELSYAVIKMNGMLSTAVIEVLSPSIRLLSLIVVILLEIQKKRLGRFTSLPIFVFWFTNSICGFFTSPLFDIITSNVDQNADGINFIIGSVSYPLTLMQFIFTSLPDPDYSTLNKKEIEDDVMRYQSFFSYLCFSWMNRLIRYGFKHDLTADDIDKLSPEDRSAKIYDKLFENWKVELKKQKESPTKKPSLVTALAKTMWPQFLPGALLELFYDFLNMLPPIFLDLLIRYVSNLQDPMWHGLVYAISLFVMSLATTFVVQHSWYYIIRASLIPKLGLTTAIYRKALKQSNFAKRMYTLGELCNFISVDCWKLFEFTFQINVLWSSPLRILLILVLLWQYLGVACLAGISIIVLILPITVFLAKKTHGLQTGQLENKDRRLRQMNDVLNGIKVLKLFAWENPFMDRISDVRQKEIVAMKHLSYIIAVLTFLWTSMPFLVTITSFVTYLLMDEKNVLDPSIAFVSLTLFNKLQNAVSVIPDAITELIKCSISIRRLEKFLLSDELKKGTIESKVSKDECIVLKNCSFSWSSNEEPTLRDISLTIPNGSLVAVVGQVGSGKSTLISAILGEMHKLKGDINVKQASVAYVAQQAWIQNATLEKNILFLKNMKRSTYDKVVEYCCLEEDLEILPAGDQTEIGEKGVNLSGGQKQRVSLARAVYQNAEIYLMDDPLSAVDSHVGAEIFKNVIGLSGILKNKTRILVTNDLSLLPNMDLIFVMADGRIQEHGKFFDLMTRKGEFAKFVEDHQRKLLEELQESAEDLSPGDDILIPRSTEELKEQMKRIGSRVSRSISAQEIQTVEKQRKQKLIEAEKMESGRVKSSIYMSYLRRASLHLIAFMVVSYVGYQGFQVASNVWLSAWSSDQVLEDGSQDVHQRNLRISIYGLLGIAQGLCILAASFLLAIASTRASRKLHAEMLTSILHSPMTFFDSTPIGRILNRFGKDINILDNNIPYSINKVLMSLLSVIGAAVVIIVSSPIFIAVILVLALFYILIQAYYLVTSRQVRRLVSVTLSPVMSNFSETVQGDTTIRAFRAEKFFIDKEDGLVDIYGKVFFSATLLNRWLSIRLELLSGILVFSVALLAVFGREQFSPGIAGLFLTYALNMTEVLTFLVKYFVNLEIRMVAVERVTEYSELPSEAPWELTDEIAMPVDWPTAGAVTFNNYEMRYRKGLDLVLRGINLCINPGEKVGIVGRTGAGKSSLTLALFRIIEPSGGSILIDCVNISTLGLHSLRSRVTIIPQDPILFSGTIRINLDPLNLYSDSQLWEALEHSHLKNFVLLLNQGLDYNVSSGGENMSVGQRQQLCLARALLKKTKILVLDEATAAVDMETDRLIQSTIRKEFDDSTVITIAHRLYTILDYDRVVVMENGKIVEEGKPDNLIQKNDSHFFKLSRDAGLV